jgi:hypothetical protein
MLMQNPSGAIDRQFYQLHQGYLLFSLPTDSIEINIGES